MTREKTLNITIDNREVRARQNQTILQAARQNGFYIPSLCALEHLPSYGACRLCMVEVDGIRGYPTACTTPVEEGMVIRTDTAELRGLRQEVLKLLLSEHPASCLFCAEQMECKEYQGTIRKVGVTTGCRYCPNDSRCELQQIAERVGLTETSCPVYYRGFPVEKSDPFYDRDYNLCILCGRCIRVCNDVRLNGTLSFKQRGKLTTIGPAFDRSHLEAGCEFCGACVSVCPTGALSVKTSKWYGRPDRVVETTCVYCPLGCRLVLQVKSGEVVDVLPDYESPVDQGLLCVKGRFAVPEYVHNAQRLTTPRRMTPIGYEDIDWNQALSLAAERLAGIEGDDFLMIVSADLCNEDLFAAQAFTRRVINSENISSAAAVEAGDDLAAFADLVLQSEPFRAFDGADVILAVGFDGSYGFSPLAVAIKKALNRGAALAVIGASPSSLDMYASACSVGDRPKWADIITRCIDEKSLGEEKKARSRQIGGEASPGAEGDWEAFGRLCRSSGRRVLVVGPDVFSWKDRQELFRCLFELRDGLGWRTVVAHPYTNFGGLVAMGAIAGLKPGDAVERDNNGEPLTLRPDAGWSRAQKRRKVVYVIGEMPSEPAPPCDFLIYQNGLPAAAGREPDLVLPSAVFAESDGTVISAGGKVLGVRKAVDAPGLSRPDWVILNSLAERMKKGGLRFESLASIRREVKRSVQGFGGPGASLRFVRFVRAGDGTAPRKRGKGGAVPKRARHRGVFLADVVAGMKIIEAERAGEPPSPEESL